MSLIETRDLVKIYRLDGVEVPALRGISLKIDIGEYVSIMGPSGSGKSTLMHILGCLDRPTSGKYYLDGLDISELDEDRLAEIRREKIGFVFQNFNLLPRITNIENVELPMTYAGVPSKERRKRAMALLERVGLSHRAFHRPTEISGGEAQRVAIARALANDPAIILADEPTGNLDTRTGREIMNLFEELNSEGRTVIVVTHDPEVSAKTKRIIRIRDGMLEK